jgi:hypothetical protein
MSIPNFNDPANVTVGEKFTNEYSYIVGYWEAGDILVDKALALGHPFKNRLFFPICYNYRQFLELILKQLIIETENIYNDCETLNIQKKEYRYKFSANINTTHNIDKLLNWLMIILSCIADEKIDKEVIKSINEFSKLDKTGQKFRYPMSKENKKHFDEREDFDLAEIKSKIKNIGYHLSGVEAYLCHYNDFVKGELAYIEAALYPVNNIWG